MQVERLFGMVNLLMERGKMTARELAEFYGVSVRTIYRDVDVLSRADIPIYMEKGFGGGITLMEGHVIRKAALTREEKTNILTALQCVSTVIDGELIQTAGRKLNSKYGEHAKGIIEVDFTDWGEAIAPQFKVLRRGILDHRVVELDYFTSYGTEGRRKVEPYLLYFKEKAWYVQCYCLEREESRMLRLSRMRNVVLLKENFVEREFKMEHHESFTEPKMVDLVMEVDAIKKHRVFDDFMDGDISETPEGNYIVRVQKAENEYTIQDILSYGPFIKVIKPAKIRKMIVKSLEATLEAYQQPTQIEKGTMKKND